MSFAQMREMIVTLEPNVFVTSEFRQFLFIIASQLSHLDCLFVWCRTNFGFSKFLNQARYSKELHFEIIEYKSSWVSNRPADK